MVVMKFGGTSVKDPDAIPARRHRRAMRGAARTGDSGGPVVVVSAMSKVTDQLLALAAHAVAGETGAIATVIDELRDRHVETRGDGPR